MAEAKFDELIELLDLPQEARVLDIACGKAEFLLRCARRFACRGVGVDISPHFVREAREKLEAAGLASQIETIEANGADYEAAPDSFDATFCIGATWVWGGFEGTLRALAHWTKPGGLVAVGEPFWHREPSAEYLEAAGLQRSSFASHQQNAEAGPAQGLGFLHAIVSSVDDWDRYEGYKTYATERYARSHPEDPDADEILGIVREDLGNYLRWARDELGWAVYLFLKDPRPSRTRSV